MTQTYAETRMPKLLSFEEVADVLGISPRSAYRLVERGHLAAVRVGLKRLRVDAAELAAYIDRQRIPA
jgi:excisionase family DNA binding protein